MPMCYIGLLEFIMPIVIILYEIALIYHLPGFILCPTDARPRRA